MKLQYKKVILFILISTMGIGVVTLSVTPNHHSNNNSVVSASEDITPTVAVSQTPVTLSPIITVSPAIPTLIPSPTPLPIYPLEEKGYPDITKLFTQYYKAKLNGDLEVFKECLSNPDKAPTQKQLKADAQFKEEYKNIKCYVKKGYQQGTYIVFVYYELKFVNIKTSAPAVTQFYVITDKDGKLKIYSDDLDKEIGEYYNARKQDEDVQTLSENTENKFAKAIRKDADLKTFYDNLTKLLSSSKE